MKIFIFNKSISSIKHSKSSGDFIWWSLLPSYSDFDIKFFEWFLMTQKLSGSRIIFLSDALAIVDFGNFFIPSFCNFHIQWSIDELKFLPPDIVFFLRDAEFWFVLAWIIRSDWPVEYRQIDVTYFLHILLLLSNIGIKSKSLFW